jgi:hypothetical protein
VERWEDAAHFADVALLVQNLVQVLELSGIHGNEIKRNQERNPSQIYVCLST